MTNADSILELLDEVFPDSYCDDCLSRELGIQPRQQVNQIGRRLQTMGKTARQRGNCSSCKKIKTINTIIKSGPAPTSSQTPKAAHQSPATYTASATTPTGQQFDIERSRTEIVRMCHLIWKKHSQDDPPHSISLVINTLKNDNLLPPHQANMMLTLCNLRNVYVYENMPLGPREMNIAQNALSIIQEWWSTSRR